MPDSKTIVGPVETVALFLLTSWKMAARIRSMSSQVVGLRVASVIFGLFALIHLWRLVKQLPAMLGTQQIPMSVSVVALIVAGVLSIWMWRLSFAPKS